MTRRLEPQTLGAGSGDKTEVLRIKGAPVETITLDVEIDATDQLEQADPTAASVGIYPQLSALELLIYPTSSLVIANTARLLAGTMEIVPPAAPLLSSSGGQPPAAGADRQLQHHRGGLRRQPESHPRQGLPGPAVLSYNDFPSLHPGYYASSPSRWQGGVGGARRPGRGRRTGPGLVQLRRQAGVIHV